MVGHPVYPTCTVFTNNHISPYTIQQLTNKFRLDYTRLWTSALRSDIEGLKHYSEVLGVGPLYELFACMVTGRSWGSITTGIAQETTAGEVSSFITGWGWWSRTWVWLTLSQSFHGLPSSALADESLAELAV